MYTTSQKFVAEFLGTFALVFFGAGSICADRYLQASGGSIGLLGIALAYGLAMAIMVSALGHISGGHFNPAVSIGFWVTKRIGTMEVFLYWAAQILGGIAAAFLLRALFPEETWRAVALGTPELVRDFSRLSAMVLEGVASFFLVLVFFATAVDERGAFRSIAGFGIGFTITLGFLAIGPFTGAAMNPARAFGPALASNHWTSQGVYWIGPLAGGFLAGLLYDSLYLKKTV
jgi:MIP family channel proteins